MKKRLSTRKARTSKSAKRDTASAVVKPSTPTRRTDAAPKPATPLEVLVSRALDQELDWYFSYAEAALRRQDIAMLPSYAAARVFAGGAPEGEGRPDAAALGRTVAVCLTSLPGPHASVLRAAYTPRRWPLLVWHEFQCLSGIAVRLTLGQDLWPARAAKSGLEEGVAMRLAAAIAGTTSKLSLERIKAEASRLLGGAVVAYTNARALEGAALGVA